MLYRASGTVLTEAAAEAGETVCAVPQGITELAPYCFARQDWQQIILPKTLEIIERSAFEGCKKLNSVYMSENLSYLGYRAFADCPALSSLRIPAAIQDVALDVLTGCTGLSTLSLPDTPFRANFLQSPDLKSLRFVYFRHRGRNILINEQVRDWEKMIDFLLHPNTRHPYARNDFLIAQLFDMYPELAPTAGQKIWFGKYLADHQMTDVLADVYKTEGCFTAAQKDELIEYLIRKSEQTGDADMYLRFLRRAGLPEDGISRGKLRL